jgi:DNA-binding response OmpR family regulator
MNAAKKHILIADSDEQALIALEHLLENQGFDTITAWTTNQAMDFLQHDKFDLLLVADHPPEVNCELVLRKTRQESQTPLVVLENLPRHPFAEPYLMTLGATKIVHKWQHDEVRSTVAGMLNPSTAISVKSGVASAANLG